MFQNVKLVWISPNHFENRTGGPINLSFEKFAIGPYWLLHVLQIVHMFIRKYS